MEMTFGSFRFLPQTFLGIDIGTSSLKVIELSRWGERVSLKNYGELRAEALYDKPFRSFEKNTLLLSSKDVARAVRAILQEARIQTKKAVLSIPDFASFFTNFELPPMTKEELPDAVRYEARKHVPVSLADVTFDWQIVEGRVENKQPLNILLVAVPNEIINQYQEIAKGAGLELNTLEAEVFGLMRSSLGGEKRPVLLMDIGAQSTTINIVHRGALFLSHSVDVAGNDLTERISKSLGIDENTAEKEKIQSGVGPGSRHDQILAPLVDVIFMEAEKIIQHFAQTERKEIEKVVIGGGSAMMPGLRAYAQESLRKETEIADPFRSVFYPPILEPTMKELGAAYAVAIGAAMRELS